MKMFYASLFILVICVKAQAQDGSDTRYFEVDGVDSSFIGEYVHFDFFRNSFRGKYLDTVSIKIGNKLINFIERRKDDGFNNWFDQQYLEALERIDDQAVRISKFRLDSVTKGSFKVTMYLDFHGEDNKPGIEESKQLTYWFEKKIIVAVLVKSKQV